MTNWFGSTAVVPIAAPKKKRTLLPLLTVVFIVSYALMTFLIVEQGSAIQSQSNLIKLLMTDSRELWGLKAKALVEKQGAKDQAQPRTQLPPAQNPSSNTQAQSPAVAGSQPHGQNHGNKATKPQVQFPPIPASDLDPRRSVRTI